MTRLGINWVRGMLRLWLVLSVVWAVSIVVALRPDRSVQEYLQYQNMITENENAPNPFSQFADERQRVALREAHARMINEAQKRMSNARSEVAASAALIVTPSLLLLVLGVAVYWITIGFKRESP